MKLNIRELTKNDNEAALELCSLRNTGTEIFKVNREPSFFNFSKSIGHKTIYYGAFQDNLLLGCGGITHQYRKSINGEIIKLGYIHDLRTRPNSKLEVIKKIIEVPFLEYSDGCKFVFANIIDSNQFLKGFLEKRKIPGPFSRIPKISKIEHCQVDFAKENSANNDFIIEQIESKEAFKYWCFHAPPFSLIEPCLFDDTQSQAFSIKNKDKKVIAMFNLVDQSKARNFYINNIQKIKVKYISNVCGELSRDDIISLAGAYFGNLKCDFILAYSSNAACNSNYMKSNILLWDVAENENNFNLSKILMDLNEI